MGKEIKFSELERRSFLDVGAFLCVPRQTTLREYQQQRSFDEVDVDNDVLDLRPRPIEVAIFPKDFIIAGSIYNDRKNQYRKLKADEAEIRSRFGIDVVESLPQLPEALGVIFEYEDTTGVRLLNEDCDGKPEYGNLIRTATCAKSKYHGFGKESVCLGRRVLDRDILVYQWGLARGWETLAVARWVVPGKVRERWFTRFRNRYTNY